MGQQVLITGGAGFIGSHLADQLLERGHRVRVLDSLAAQVHGDAGERPAYLHDDVQLMRGDVTAHADVRRALRDVDAVYHLAALVGVGQSMYQIEAYTRVNEVGTATLLEAIVEQGGVGRLVVASSMSVYGEGRYVDETGRVARNVSRDVDAMRRGQWEPVDGDGRALQPAPTPEEKPAELASVYALSKYAQERLALIVGHAYGIPTVALRFFNAYGPRQALSNPYTGVLAIFASRLLNGRPPIVYEDGRQLRDFVSVHDVARACAAALEADAAAGEVINIGSGQPRTVLEVADRLAAVLGRSDVKPHLSGQYRVGDIRHCYADVERARRLLGYEPRMSFDDGLAELAQWVARQGAQDHVEQAHGELNTRGLTV
ncbi:MAG: SDR family NAD(P)-dependent oxidoreductase [Phycisphaeraceae bacterium]